MGLFRDLKNRWKKNRSDYDDYEETENGGGDENDWQQVVYARDQVDIHDPVQRREYVRGCLDQIADASHEIDSLTYEYNMVTSYLRDMEEIEALPKSEREALDAAADNVIKMQQDREHYIGRKSRMTEEQFERMQAIEKDADDGSRKLFEAEEYQKKIKADLRRLDGERQAFAFRRHELDHTIDDTRAMMIMGLIALCVCFVMLLVLQFAFGMETEWGYIIAAGFSAVFYVLLFLRNREAQGELKNLNHDRNKLVQLQNTVKIRYVNNTNLLDYLYMKYNVGSADEFSRMWQKYQQELAEREKFRKTELQLDRNEKEMLHILRRYNLYDADIWLDQARALLDHGEMVEIRHNLFLRRQSLRRRMDYNREVIAAKAKDEIKDLAGSYPRYAREIMSMVDEYDKGGAS